MCRVPNSKLWYLVGVKMDFPGGSDGKAAIYNAGETLSSILGREDPWRRKFIIHSSIIGLKIPHRGA